VNERHPEEERPRQAARPAAVPRHIAIIMDGNGRWAQRRNLPRTRGHEEGATSVREVVRECSRLGVEYLTLYAFSIENWKRPRREVDFLMRLLGTFLVRETKALMDQNVVLDAIGRLDDLPATVRRKLHDTIVKTRPNTGLRACLALNYGGRTEIIDAARRIAEEARAGKLDPAAIDEGSFRRYLYADYDGEPFPDPDLLIRTAGEMRLSNFLLWQASYTELYVTDVCWPDFRGEQLRLAVEEYGRRERKFGALKGK